MGCGCGIDPGYGRFEDEYDRKCMEEEKYEEELDKAYEWKKKYCPNMEINPDAYGWVEDIRKCEGCTRCEEFGCEECKNFLKESDAVRVKEIGKTRRFKHYIDYEKMEDELIEMSKE